MDPYDYVDYVPERYTDEERRALARDEVARRVPVIEQEDVLEDLDAA